MSEEFPNQQPPVVLDGFLQPGFPAKVFTAFFVTNHLVFAKTGSFATNAGGTMQAFHGGFSDAGLIAGAVGGIMDVLSSDSRSKNAAAMASYSPDAIVAAHKNNFKLPLGIIKSVEIKGPNFAGEVKVIVNADREHKFRIDRQSKASAKYIIDVFNTFLPGRVIVK